MEAFALVAFRDDLDAEFLARMRRESAEVRRVAGVEVFKYVKKGKVIPQSPDAPAGYGGPQPDVVSYVVIAATNGVVRCADFEQATAYIGSLAAKNTIAARRPAWLRWDPESTVVGFRVFLRRGEQADPVSYARHDPQAQGLVVTWNPRQPETIRVRYHTEKPEPSAWFADFSKKLLWGRPLETRPAAGGVEGWLTFGKVDLNEKRQGEPLSALEGHLLSLLLVGVFITV